MSSYLAATKQRGGILLMSLVLLAAFLVMMIAMVRLVGRQATQLTVQERTEQARVLSESGVQYALWYFNNRAETGADPASPDPIELYGVDDPITGELVGYFSLSFSSQDLGGYYRISVVSLGQDGSKQDEVSIARAVLLQTAPGSDFYIREFNTEI